MGGGSPGEPARQVTRVVLDPVAVADLPDHLEIEHRPLMKALRLQHAAGPFEFRHPLLQLRLDALDGLHGALARRHEVRLREDGDPFVPAHVLAGQRIEGQDLVDFVTKQADAQADVFVGRIELDDVPAHAKSAARKLVVVALVLDLDELPQDLVARDLLALLERHQQPVIRLRRSQAVDARHAGDDDDVAAFEERSRGRQPKAIDLFVDDRLLLDVGVRGRHEGFRLIVVVVADEELDGVVRKELPELLDKAARPGSCCAP